MPEELKELIAKIKKEGITAAEEKAKEIEDQARMKANEILVSAKEKAQALLSEAKTKASQDAQRTRALLDQAGRDLLLSLRKEINIMLERLITFETDSALSAAELQRIIVELVKARADSDADVVISLKKGDLEALEKKFLGKLKEETRKNIVLKPSSEIRAGFTISFDGGKSCYDFSDKALAEYIGRFLKPKLNEILKSAAID